MAAAIGRNVSSLFILPSELAATKSDIELEPHMKHLLATSAVLLAILPSLAHATSVYPGCRVPTVKAGRHTFFVDPNKGSPTGDGSAAKPWRTLAEVLNYPAKALATQGHKVRGGTDPLVDINSGGSIKAGDVIMLMSGNHGDVFIQGSFNKDFVTVMAAPGQTPVLRTLKIQSSQNWLFQGLKIISGTDPINATGIASLAYGDWVGITNNVILDNSTVATVESTDGWSNADWLKKPKTLGVWLGANAPCLSVTNNHILNIANGIAVASPQAMVQGNTIEQMSNDGIDITASNVVIKGNTIKNGSNFSDSGFHADGIQGWSPLTKGVYPVMSNVVIDGNTLIKTGDGSKDYMQGISIFDGNWNNLTITNNSVAVNTWNGIVVSAAKNSKIINNTVVATDPKFQTRLSIAAGKDKTLPSNTTVRNNITSDFYVVGTNMKVDHNIASYAITFMGAPVIKSGSAGNDNKIINSVTTGFMTADIANGTFDLRLRPNSVAVAAGNATDAPAVDILGITRKLPVDNGAYTLVK